VKQQEYLKFDLGLRTINTTVSMSFKITEKFTTDTNFIFAFNAPELMGYRKCLRRN